MIWTILLGAFLISYIWIMVANLRGIINGSLEFDQTDIGDWVILLIMILTPILNIITGYILINEGLFKKLFFPNWCWLGNHDMEEVKDRDFKDKTGIKAICLKCQHKEYSRWRLDQIKEEKYKSSRAYQRKIKKEKLLAQKQEKRDNRLQAILEVELDEIENT